MVNKGDTIVIMSKIEYIPVCELSIFEPNPNYRYKHDTIILEIEENFIHNVLSKFLLP